MRIGDDVGRQRTLSLMPRSVATFYRWLMESLEEMGLPVEMWPVPVEVETAIPFAEDETHASY